MANSGVDKRRRRFLIAATSVVGAVGTAAVAAPFISSWSPSARALAAGAPVEVPVGKVEPGATGNVDAMVNGIAPTMDEGIIKVEISYEDAAGNITTSEKEISLYVSEMVDPGIDGGFEEEIPVEENKTSTIIIVVAAVVVVVVIAVIIILIKKKKKKKAELELQKEIEGIDEP